MYVQVDGGTDAPSAALQQLGGITRVTEVDRLDGVIGYEVECESGRDLRRDIARAVVAAGWGLLELRPIRASLEDIFLQLTTEEQSGEATIQ
jgi:ABC-2 type transport system ATP-binding protein